MMRRHWMKLAAALCVAGTMGVANAQQVLKVTTIPEEAATEQVRKFGPLTR